MADAQHRIQLLIVDDSLFFRNMLKIELSKDTGFEVTSLASDPYEARDKIVLFDPDVMVLDVNLPRMNGVEFIKRLMAQYPIPVVGISSLKDYVDEAVQAGAMSGVEKPRAGGERDIQAFISELSEKIRLAYINDPRRKQKSVGGAQNDGRFGGAESKTYAQSRGGAAGGHAAGGAAANMAAGGAAANTVSGGVSHTAAGFAGKTPNRTIIAIGASTGGTNAIADIITALPAGLPGIVIVQHMPAEFTTMFAHRLNAICAFPVCEAESGNRVTPGRALVAPGNFQLKVVRNGDDFSVLIQPGEKVSGHCPSVDVMFASVAECAGSKAIGVLLTGMGQDGANGLLAMKNSGALTIGQDEKSSVVYGMPKVANDIGAVTYQLPLNQIASRIVALL